MTFDYYKELVARTQYKYVHRIMQGMSPREAERSAGWDDAKAIARNHLEAWDMVCVADVLDKALPKSNTLTLQAISEEVIEMKGYRFKVKLKPYGYTTVVHFTFHSLDGSPLPISETGYLSKFVPITSFVNSTIMEFIEHVMKDVEVFVPDPQLSLF